jgi:hypothetical protein
MSMVTCRYYQMVIIATGEDVMSPDLVATEGNSNDGWLDDTTAVETRSQDDRC